MARQQSTTRNLGGTMSTTSHGSCSADNTSHHRGVVMNTKRVFLCALAFINTLRFVVCSDSLSDAQNSSPKLLTPNDPNVNWQYCSVLKAMVHTHELNANLANEEISEAWKKYLPEIQQCKTLNLSCTEITELPYEALEEMKELSELNLAGNNNLEIDSKRFKALQERLTSLDFSFNNIRNQDTFNAIIRCKCLKRLKFDETSLENALLNDWSVWGNVRNTVEELSVSNTGLNSVGFREITTNFRLLKILNASNNNLGGIGSRFEFSKPSVLEKLYLGSCKLKALPKSIGKLTGLSHLKLSSNKLTELPRSICNLKDLKNLDLSFNKLMYLPEAFGNLPHLTVLDLSSNELRYIPKNIGSLPKLEHLYLSHNKLRVLPATMIELEKTLLHIDLKHNNELARSGDMISTWGSKDLKGAFGNRVLHNDTMLLSIDRDPDSHD